MKTDSGEDTQRIEKEADDACNNLPDDGGLVEPSYYYGFTAGYIAGATAQLKELASLREQLKEANYWANEQANTLNALADRNAELSSELNKSNHNYLLIVEHLKQKDIHLDVIERDLYHANANLEIATDLIKQKEDENRELVTFLQELLDDHKSGIFWMNFEERTEAIIKKNLST